MITQERQHDDITEHMHDEYEYWHPVTRVHESELNNNLPADHVLAPEVPRGLQVQPFDWTEWDAGCHAKGICQGYQRVQLYVPQDGSDPDPGKGVQQQLHHRAVDPDLMGIAETYWQCPHCRTLQKLIQWAEGARLETYKIATRGNRVVLWLKVSSGQWYVMKMNLGVTVQKVAQSDTVCVSSYNNGLHTYQGGQCRATVYAVGNYPPQQMPDEITTALARRFWHRITKGYWSDRPKEVEE